VRVWGTVGWAVVAWGFPALFLQENVGLQLAPPFLDGTDRADATARIAQSLRVAAVISWSAAAFCLWLPHTPPTRHATHRFAALSASRLLRFRSIVVLIGTSLSVAAIDRIYYVQTAPYLEWIGLRTSHIMPAMALGQIGEILVMALLSRMIAGLGFRRVLALGALCSCLRYAIFGTTGLPLPLIVASQLLQGFCFPCSFVAAMIYVDRLVTRDARHSAQTGFTLVAMGPGAILGGLLSGWLERQFQWAGQLDYSAFWYTCSAVGLAAVFCILLLFRDESGLSAEA
jgi:hypothetical protein